MVNEIDNFSVDDCCDEMDFQRSRVLLWTIIGFTSGILSLALLLAFTHLIISAEVHPPGTRWEAPNAQLNPGP